jgi:branched-chain amino acid aminotransferase
LELITPSLDGTVLPGVTRASVIELTRSWGEFVVTEGRMTMGALERAVREKRVREVFGSGTAVIISPVKCIHFRGQILPIPLDVNQVDSQAGPLAKRISSHLLDIQYGEKTFSDWSYVVP